MRILFICHEATRTGVPLLLLQLIKWLKSSHGIEVFVILVQGGPLESEFRKVSPVFIWHLPPLAWNGKFNYSMLTRVVKKSINKSFRKKVLKDRVAAFDPDVCYLNSAATLNFVHSNFLVFSKRPIFLHCHEMPHTLKKYVPDAIEYLFQKMSGIIVVNKTIEKFFLSRSIHADKLLLVPEYMSKTFVSPGAMKKCDGKFRVISSGLGSWRKGIDLFVLTAYYFSLIYDHPFLFTWVGAIPSATLVQLQYDIKMFDLTEHFAFTGEITDTSEQFNNADVFFLSSREDPYPLVMLEAAWFSKPVAYFKEAGGAGEFVNDSELEIRAFDVVAAAQKLVFLAQNEEIRQKKGAALREKVLSHTVDNVGELLLKFVNEKRDIAAKRLLI